jgi:hypothetical protein
MATAVFHILWAGGEKTTLIKLQEWLKLLHLISLLFCQVLCCCVCGVNLFFLLLSSFHRKLMAGHFKRMSPIRLCVPRYSPSPSTSFSSITLVSNVSLSNSIMVVLNIGQTWKFRLDQSLAWTFVGDSGRTVLGTFSITRLPVLLSLVLSSLGRSLPS